MSKLTTPRAVWVMVPAAFTGETVDRAGRAHGRRRHHHRRRELLLPRRHRPGRGARARGSHYVDVGTSGGVFGLERGFCLMIGGETRCGRAPGPDLRHASLPGVDAAARTPGREGDPITAEQGYLHCGPNGAGHFVKMVHNGIEYGIMAAYAEGLGILRKANVGKQSQDARRRDRAAARSAVLPVRHRRGRGRRGLAPGQRHLVVAAGPHRHGLADDPDPRGFRRPSLRLR